MKITCPECASRFDVPIPLMGAGRRVRCGHCGHVWMQTPVQDDAFGGFKGLADEAMDPIPLSLHPGSNADPDENEGGANFFSGINWGMLGRMAAGFVIGWALLGGLAVALAFGHMLPRSFMPLAVAMGAPHPADLQGLAIEDVTAVADEHTTHVTGQLVNAGSAAHVLPTVEILPVGKDGTLGEGKSVTLTQASIKAGETVPFDTTLKGAFDQDTLRLRLIP